MVLTDAVVAHAYFSTMFSSQDETKVSVILRFHQIQIRISRVSNTKADAIRLAQKRFACVGACNEYEQNPMSSR